MKGPTAIWRAILFLPLMVLVTGVLETVAGETGIRPYQDLVDVEYEASVLDTKINVVNGNVIHVRPDLRMPGQGLPPRVVFSHNSRGVEDSPWGYGWQMNYAVQCRVNPDNGNITILRPDGRKDAFVRQQDGSFVSSEGVFDQLRTWGQGYRLTVWSDPVNHDGGFVVYDFDANDLPCVSDMWDRNGNRLDFTYEEGLLRTITDPIGRTIQFEYEDRRLSRLMDFAGQAWVYQFDGEGHMVQVTNPLGGTTQYGYDSATHAILRVTDALGRTTEFSYVEGMASKVVDPLGQTAFVFAYQVDGLSCTRVTDALDNTTTYSYDNRGRVVSVTDALEHTLHRAWDEQYRLVSLTDQNGDTTTFTYDSQGHPLTVTNPLGHTRSYAWDTAIAQPTRVTDERGNTTRYQYSAQGNLIRRIDAEGGEMSCRYDEAGNRISKTNELGRSWTYAYNSAGMLTEETDPLGACTVYTYDDWGRLISQTDAHGFTLTHEYDGLGRLVASADSLGGVTRYTYDAAGNLIEVVNRNGRAMQYTYDAMNRLVRRIDPLGATTQFEYNQMGNLTSQTDPTGLTVTFAYDALGRLVRRTSPGGSIWTYAYDGVGRCIRRTDAKGQVTTYAYDAAGRRIETRYPEGSIDWVHDAGGNLIEVRSRVSLKEHAVYRYDALNRLTSYTMDYGDFIGEQTVASSYDAAGNRTSLTHPNGQVSSYLYDPADRLVEVHSFDGVTRYEYDALGRRTCMIYPDGMRVDYGFDALGRPASLVLTNPSDSVLFSQGYTYVGPDDPTAESLNDAALTRQIQYDALNRIVQATYIDGDDAEIHQYTYDASGRRLTKTVNDQTTSYVYDGEGLLVQETGPAATTVYRYDMNGNRIEKTTDQETFTYVYDAENRLVSMEWPHPISHIPGPFFGATLPRSYLYTALGQRVGINDRGWRSYFICDGTDVLVEQGSQYTILYNPKVSAVEGKRVVYPVYDHHSTSIAEIWPEGLAWTEPYRVVDFDAFGVKRRGSSEVLTTWNSNIWDPIAESFWDGYDPFTGAGFGLFGAGPDYLYDIFSWPGFDDLQIGEYSGQDSSVAPTVKLLGSGRVGVFGPNGAGLGEMADGQPGGKDVIVALQNAGYTPDQIANLLAQAARNGTTPSDVSVDKDKSLVTYQVGGVDITLSGDGDTVLTDGKTYRQRIEPDGTKTTYFVHDDGTVKTVTVSPDGTREVSENYLGQWGQNYDKEEVFELLQNPRNMIVSASHGDYILTVDTSTNPDGSVLHEYRNPFNGSLTGTTTVTTDADGTVVSQVRDSQGNLQTRQTVTYSPDGTQVVHTESYSRAVLADDPPPTLQGTVTTIVRPDGSSSKTFKDGDGYTTEVRDRRENADGTIFVEQVTYTRAWEDRSVVRETFTIETTFQPDGSWTKVVTQRAGDYTHTHSETNTPLPGGGYVNDLIGPDGNVVWRKTVDGKGYIVSMEKFEE